MSEKVEVEVLFQSSAAWVFQRPDRGFPSITIQGDTLGLLDVRVSRIRQLIEQDGKLDEDGIFDLELVQEMLAGLNEIYKQYGNVTIEPSQRR